MSAVPIGAVMIAYVKTTAVDSTANATNLVISKSTSMENVNVSVPLVEKKSYLLG